MLFLSDAKISVRSNGAVRVEGKWERYETRIIHYVQDLDLTNASIRFRFGRYVFSGNLDADTRQQLRNFLVNECRIRK